MNRIYDVLVNHSFMPDQTAYKKAMSIAMEYRANQLDAAALIARVKNDYDQDLRSRKLIVSLPDTTPNHR